MSWSTKFFTGRLDKFFDEADQALTTYARDQYQDAADEIADRWAAKVRQSGRGGSHNAEMANIDGRVTMPRRGGFFIRIGWLNNPPVAADGRTTWFVYQDVGYDPFGMIAKGYNASRVPGIFAQMDARQQANSLLYAATDRIVARVGQAARRTRH